MSKDSLHKLLFISSLFAISMAFLESAIVVYLRALYYPEGFHFPIKEIPYPILMTEIGREAATIIMLWTFARVIGKNAREVFAYFAYNFGLWDIWYYIWLKVLLGWPVSLLDWDVLFLIPAPWLSPVLAPVLVSIALCIAGYLILKFEQINQPIKIRRTDWILEVLAGLIIILSFLITLDSLTDIQEPDKYPWWLFSIGMCLGIIVFVNLVVKSKKRSKNTSLNNSPRRSQRARRSNNNNNLE